MGDKNIYIIVHIIKKLWYYTHYLNTLYRLYIPALKTRKFYLKYSLPYRTGSLYQRLTWTCITHQVWLHLPWCLSATKFCLIDRDEIEILIKVEDLTNFIGTKLQNICSGSFIVANKKNSHSTTRISHNSQSLQTDRPMILYNDKRWHDPVDQMS